MAATLAIPPAAAKGAGVAVDLELVLAVDISYSMDADEQQLQREGYVAAITSKPVLDAVAQGMLGRIAVAYVEWAGADEQRTVVQWTLIDGKETAARFAARLAASPLRRAYRTSISGALMHASRIFENNGFDGARKVIDVSGDGPNNQGEAVEGVRGEVIERGIVINGLPLMMKRPSYAMMDLGELDAYYRDCVIGGPGAFVLPVRAISQFPEAVRTKLVMEIAGLIPEEPHAPLWKFATEGWQAVMPAPSRVSSTSAKRGSIQGNRGYPAGAGHDAASLESSSGIAERRAQVVPAGAVRPTPVADCSAGEQLWRERFGD